MSRVDVRYICQRAANAIISEIGPYRVSTDALQAINQFLDEFLRLLLASSLSLDLSRTKAVVFDLLPSTLGKNAIVEAELEVKTFTETETIDIEVYERMRSLDNLPLETTLPLLRDKCLEFCTLADKEEQQQLQVTTDAEKKNAIVISPIVAIYITTVLEHIAEYILTAIAMIAENEDIEYVRVKEVYVALVDDSQVGGVFSRMEMREKMEKRAIAYGYRPRSSMMPAQSRPVSRKQSYLDMNGNTAFLNINFDDADLAYEDNDQDRFSSTYSLKSNNSAYRPTSVLTSSTSNGTVSTVASSTTNSSKKAFKLFKKDARQSTVESQKSPPLSVSVYDPDAPTMNFEDLIRSGNTMRVSLTPNRLRSIEVKDLTEAPPEPTWERRSSAMPRKSTASAKLAPPLPSSPPPTQQQQHRLTTPSAKSEPLLDDTLKRFEILQQRALLESPVDPANVAPKPAEEPPVAAAVAAAAAMTARFENPREAPKPPVQKPASQLAKQRQSVDEPKKEIKVLRRGSMSSRKSRENLRRQRLLEEQAALAAENAPELPRDLIPNNGMLDLPTPPPSEDLAAAVQDSRRNSLKKSFKVNKSAPNLSIHNEDRQVHFTSEPDSLDSTIPERPSVVVAKRRQSLHENNNAPNRLSTAGSVGMSIKAWDEILKQNMEDRRRSTISMSFDDDDTNNNSGSEVEGSASSRRRSHKVESKVLDKVLKFEGATSLDDYRASYVPRRQRFVYLQRNTNALERKTTRPLSRVAPMGVDMAVQTEPSEKKEDVAPTLVVTTEDDSLGTMARREIDAESIMSHRSSERGVMDGDEEWFLQDDEWDDIQDQENAVVEWLLGDA
ncbi:hypothetical protein DFQ28_006416 [Apophysomyces sp. BC1034]|nr:hypothetical protein DFQ30_005182 [Apophysomyces sp. BC1015]KAG0178748.1 hypothetical protein DFQ29_003054 [Apophysomyces sp. BC1021]KAG0187381.1 hypothetical protein DFQ28_006416 [Apophysomyces sp. BC1034]